MSLQALAALEKTNDYLSIGHYSSLTIRNYLSELRYLFAYFADTPPASFTEAMVMQYLLYLSKTLGCSRPKCRMAAQSISFFFRHVLKTPYVIPSVVYPRKSTTLPAVMSMEEIKTLIDSVINVKHRTIIMMLYSSGIRLSEIADLKITDIDSKRMRIKIEQGKGAKDRFTVLSEQVLVELSAYYLIYKPKEYLFNGDRPGKKYSMRSIQHLVQKALIKIGLDSKNYSVHTIRHSFATHLLDSGTDLYTIKELLGHRSLQTTMQYLHLTSARIDKITSPYDLLPGNQEHKDILALF